MIDENKLAHILAVARLMAEKAELVGLDRQEMFALGLVHDIGFEFGGSETHHQIGAQLLKNQNYKYWQEVLHHGKPTKEFQSKELDLLNYADMHIDKMGNYVSFEDRLKDIASRRGEDSPHYKNSQIVIKQIKERLNID